MTAENLCLWNYFQLNGIECIKLNLKGNMNCTAPTVLLLSHWSNTFDASVYGRKKDPRYKRRSYWLKNGSNVNWKQLTRNIRYLEGHADIQEFSINYSFFYICLGIPDICHFFTRTKFLQSKIYTEKTRKLRQNTQ